MPKLIVLQAKKEDVYKDIARIHFEDRGGIREGNICKVTKGVCFKYLSVRGITDGRKGVICLDELSRTLLGVTVGEETEFGLKPSGIWGQAIWGWFAADPSTRLSTQVALISLALGVVGLVLGIWSLFLTL